MNDAGYQQLLELSWRRKLTGAEEAELQKYQHMELLITRVVHKIGRAHV